MYNLGMVDDDQQQFSTFKRRFRNINKEIAITLVDNCETYQEIYNWIIDKKIECLLVDHKLANQYSFNGVELVNYVNSKIPDLPCVILTSYTEDAESEKLVIKPLIFDKNLMGEKKDSEKLNNFINLVIHGVDVFRNRMELNKAEYTNLLKNKEKLNAEEYTRLEELFHILKSYGIIDEVSVLSLNDKFQNEIDKIINRLDKIIEK